MQTQLGHSMAKKFQYRALFISDIHLGTSGCQADMLLSFLHEVDADYIYLVGDIFDGWRLKKGWYWPQTHNNVVQRLLKMAKNGSNVIYIPGNHDEVMRSYLGTHFGGIEVRDRDIYTSVDGRKFLVIHGDQFDMVVMNAKWLAHLGDWAYATILRLNTYVNYLRRLWGGQYWSLSRWAKNQVKSAVNFIGEYEKVLCSEAKKADVQGIICGHIHHPALEQIDDITYINTGDWVESCTAVIESHDGAIELVEWAKITRARAQHQHSLDHSSNNKNNEIAFTSPIRTQRIPAE